MFRFTMKPSSGSHSQCLAKITHWVQCGYMEVVQTSSVLWLHSMTCEACVLCRAHTPHRSWLVFGGAGSWSLGRSTDHPYRGSWFSPFPPGECSGSKPTINSVTFAFFHALSSSYNSPSSGHSTLHSLGE